MSHWPKYGHRPILAKKETGRILTEHVACTGMEASAGMRKWRMGIGRQTNRPMSVDHPRQSGNNHYITINPSAFI